MKTEKKCEADQKILRKEKLHKIFPASFIALLFFLFAFIYWISSGESDMLLFIILILITIFIGTYAFIFLTIKVKRDLRINEIELIERKVEDKSHIIDYEAGSGTLHSPVLGTFFKAFRQEMKQIEYYQIKLNGEQIRIPKEIYEKVEKGQLVFIRQSINSNTFLGVRLLNSSNT